VTSPSTALAAELTPKVEELLDRHLDMAKEWFPHELVPWDRAAGRGIDDADRDWKPDMFPMSDGVRSALFVNLLTEDNLPYYFHTIDRMFGRDGAWGEWARRWTAEEGRHSMVIRDYLTVTDALDPVELERSRMVQVSRGVVPEPADPVDGLVYVALQELATRIAHRNTGKALDDPAGMAVMSRVAADENLHFLFYRDLVATALEIDPSTVLASIERQVRDFEMPGTGIPAFTEHANAIARAGIYDFLLHHDQVLVPVVLRHWAIEKVTGLTDAAEQARDRVLKRIERIGKAGQRLARRAAERAAEAAGGATPRLV
jgi:acyl-[acyl-carrier-protein] desaturase